MCDNGRECEAAVRQGFAGRASRDAGDAAAAAGVQPARSLVDRLGVTPGMRVSFLCVSDEDLVAAVIERSGDAGPGPRGVSDAILFEAADAGGLARVPALAAAIERDGMVWVLWRRRGALTQNDVRRAGLDAGLVDVKVTRVSDELSALKFVYRLRDR